MKGLILSLYLSNKSLEQMGIRPDGAHTSQESYEHLGKINTSTINLDERYQELIKRRRVFLAAEEADIIFPYEFAASPAVLWDWLIDPHKKTRWMKGSAWEVKERPMGRTGPAAQNHCTNIELISVRDCRPPDALNRISFSFTRPGRHGGPKGGQWFVA